MISFQHGATADALAKTKENLPAPPPTSGQPAASPSATPSPRSSPERESDVRVITRAVYRNNDAGYLDFNHPSHIWVVKAPRTGEDKVTPTQLTKTKWSDGNVTWARDSKSMYLFRNHNDEPYYDLPKTDVFNAHFTGGQPSRLTTFEMGAATF